MKQIVTGTKITFKETGDKFYLTQIDTGFDLRQIKLSKNVPAESYTFQEFLELYESNQIIIEGFEEADIALGKSIITNYIYNTTLKDQISQIEKLTARNDELTTLNEELTAKNVQLKIDNAALTEALEKEIA